MTMGYVIKIVRNLRMCILINVNNQITNSREYRCMVIQVVYIPYRYIKLILNLIVTAI